MQASSTMEKDLVHDESLLDLLTKQQTEGASGVRLSFHQDLLSPLSFFLSPLHYAAATGNTALVCYLYSEASCPSKQGKNITVASFSAGGRNGRTSWRIPVAVSPSQTASLAGHAVTAKALKQLENGVPLHWNRKVHSKFASNEFKLKSRKLMKTLLDADWFYALPGPARVMLTDKLMTQLARDHVWGFLDKCIWEGDWHSLLGDHMMMAIEKYSTLAAEHASSQSRNRHYPPQYQFSVGQVDDQVRRRQYFRKALRVLRRGICGGFWWLLHRSEKGGPSFTFFVGVFVATGYNEWLQSFLPLLLRIFRDPANS